MVLDPERYALRAPNVTGLSLKVPLHRQFQTIRTLLPAAKRVGVLYDPDRSGDLVDEARRPASRLGIELVERQVRDAKDVPAALRSMLTTIDALWLVPDSTVLTDDSFRFILNTTLDTNVPVIAFSSEFVRNGALAALSIHPDDIGRQAGELVKRLLSGGRPQHGAATVPPDRVRLAVNLKTAKYLGVLLPGEIVSSADEVF